MITKGVVIGQSPRNKNKYIVNMPTLNQVHGDLTDVRLDEMAEASVSVVSGMTNQIQPGDIVFIGFEDHDAHKPIILGGLYTTEQPVNGYTPDIKQLPDIVVRSLQVIDGNGAAKAILPEDTTIGAISSGSLKALEGLAADNLERRLQDLQEQITSGGIGISKLSDLTDVELTNLQNGQILKWDSSQHKWVNADETGGSGNDFTVDDENMIISVIVDPEYIITTNISATLYSPLGGSGGSTVTKTIDINTSNSITNDVVMTIDEISLDFENNKFYYRVSYREFREDIAVLKWTRHSEDATITQVGTSTSYSLTTSDTWSIRYLANETNDWQLSLTGTITRTPKT